MTHIKILLKNLLLIAIGVLVLAQSTVTPDNELERLRTLTRAIEFDYIDWTFDALIVKNFQESVKAPRYLTVDDQRNTVFGYLDLVSTVNQTTREINRIYADPNIQDPDKEAAELNERLRDLKEMENSLKPIAESIIQDQITKTLTDLDLTVAGQPVPPVLYHVTRLPSALIISPRSVIQQDHNISLQPELTTEDINALEENVENRLDVSALVVPIGGVGTYPTMVMSTTDLEWLVEVVSHEWVHNFLTLRPVGALYLASGEMRTINETTANLAGKEIGRAVLERYYPELAPAPEPQEEAPAKEEVTPKPTPTPQDPNVFNYNREMHKTRVQVDELLAQGEIEEAEEYMEARRRFFWEHGYQIRKLNQAYFAFYGAYNDVPGGGAGGKDPIGPAVQELRKQSSSLAEFLRRISWVTSFEALQQELQKAN